LGIVIDYGFIINQDVIDYFPLGIVNSHFSLLPEWRGADPITFAILSGQETTGVSLMCITAGMDEGPVFAQAEHQIGSHDTTPSLTSDLIELSDAMLKDFLPLYFEGGIEPRPQEEIASMMNRSITPSYSRKLTKDDGIIDWNKPAEQIEREIRAFIDWPKSRTKLAGKDVIITKAYAVPSTAPDAKPGDVDVVKEAKMLSVATSNGSLWIEQLKPAGKKEMPISAFLAGYKVD
jgi:methionyl-tRNA formyltransferase